MMDFKYAWDHFREGDKVRVSDGTPEPREGSPEHVAWKTRNFIGKLVEKRDDGDQKLVIQTPKIDLGDGHTAVSQHFYSAKQGLSFWREDVRRADVEALKRREINAVRSRRMSEGAVTSVGVLDVDPISQMNLNSALLRALVADKVGLDFSEEWTTKDNKVVHIKDASTMIKVAKEALDAVSKIHGDVRESKAMLRSRDLTAEKMLKLSFK